MDSSSIFVATFFAGDEDYGGDEWYPGPVRYRIGRIAELARASSLACEVLDWPHPSGQTWLRFTVASPGALPVTPSAAESALARLGP